MTAVKAWFDGQRIEVPDAMRNARPGEVIIVFEEGNASPTPASRPSIWDVIGKAPNPLTREECDAIIREERESWGER